MKKHPIYELIGAGTLLMDGATGTYARTRGLPENVEQACLSHPKQVIALHRAYLAAGAQAITTNTFAAHIGQQASDAAQQRAIVSAAYRLACEAVKEEKPEAFVFADIGPAPERSDAAQAYTQMAEVFLELGADCFLFETLATAEGIEAACERIKTANPSAFIAVSFAADPDGFTRAGENAASLIARMDACEYVDAVGLNCVCGAYHMSRLLDTLPVLTKPIVAQPNAGYPRVVGGRMVYETDPAYFAHQVSDMAQQGAKIVGGCCGTTPEHIRRLAAALNGVPSVSIKKEKESAAQEKICRSRIAQKAEAGQRVVLVELDPPRDTSIDRFLEGARLLTESGADAITIADCPIGRARMDSSLLACKLSRELGIEALPHMTCRDRNVNATKALLLGLSMENVNNVLVVTGDPVPTSDRGSVKSVYQFNSRVLSRFIRSLAESGEVSPFYVCGALNVNAANFHIELDRAKQKEDCGVQAFLTQPVLSERAAQNIEEARKALGGRIFGGLFPVVSHKNASFLQYEVSGIRMDEKVLRAYEGLDRAGGEAMARKLCRDVAVRIAPYVDGFYIMTPFQRVELVADVIREVREL